MVNPSKPPLESRLTKELAVAEFVGGVFQEKPRLPLPVKGEPETVKSLGANRPTLVTAPGRDKG
jgi:hypothetical protein